MRASAVGAVLLKTDQMRWRAEQLAGALADEHVCGGEGVPVVWVAQPISSLPLGGCERSRISESGDGGEAHDRDHLRSSARIAPT